MCERIKCGPQHGQHCPTGWVPRWSVRGRRRKPARRTLCLPWLELLRADVTSPPQWSEPRSQDKTSFLNETFLGVCHHHSSHLPDTGADSRTRQGNSAISSGAWLAQLCSGRQHGETQVCEAEESQGLMQLALRPTVNLNLYPETQHTQVGLG